MGPTILVMLGIISVTLLGDYFLKLAALNTAAPTLPYAIGTSCYAIAAIGIVYALRHMSMASFGVWYSVLTILAMTAMGVLLFEERLATREMVGIGFALASLVCMSRLA